MIGPSSAAGYSAGASVGLRNGSGALRDPASALTAAIVGNTRMVPAVAFGFVAIQSTQSPPSGNALISILSIMRTSQFSGFRCAATVSAYLLPGSSWSGHTITVRPRNGIQSCRLH